MIISASYKTDIPAFYGEWFMRRLEAGFCMMRNPYNGKARRVDLRPEAVDGIVFWTRNLRPLLKHLPQVKQMGYPFVVQYTITGYPRAIEHAVPPAARAIEDMQRVAADFGPKSAVWRYDPILLTSLTPVEFHLANFEQLATAMRGATDEVVVSFALFYAKTRRNLGRAAAEHGFDWGELPDGEKRELLRKFSSIAAASGMRLSACAHREFVAEKIGDARCIDAGRMSDVAGRPVVPELKSHRLTCGCHASIDIGEYDTCVQGCVYCYAVRSRELAAKRVKEHNPEGEFLAERSEDRG